MPGMRSDPKRESSRLKMLWPPHPFWSVDRGICHDDGPAQSELYGDGLSPTRLLRRRLCRLPAFGEAMSLPTVLADYRHRIGTGKISGTYRGSLWAGTRILYPLANYGWKCRGDRPDRWSER